MQEQGLGWLSLQMKASPFSCLQEQLLSDPSGKSKSERAHVSILSPQGGQARVRVTLGWTCCRNKSGGEVYVSKMVDNKGKWLAYLVCSLYACFRA